MAISPKVGAWWNPNESGRGFVFDGSGTTLAMQAYTYDASGAPQWYLAVGTLSNNGTTWVANLEKYSGGQCLGCVYKPAQSVGSDGQVSVIFTSDTTGVLTMPNGVSTPIQSFFPAGAMPTVGYAGNYQCVFDGTDSGSFSFVMSSAFGAVSNCSGRSNFRGGFLCTGQISSTGLVTTAFASTGAVATGQVTATGVTGTWINTNAGGSISCSRN